MNRMHFAGVAFSLLTATAHAEPPTDQFSFTYQKIDLHAQAGKTSKGAGPASPSASGSLTTKPRVSEGIEGTDVSTSSVTDEGGDGCTEGSKEAHC